MDEPLRTFKVHACPNEMMLEKKLNELEVGGYHIQDVFHKPAGGFTIIASIRGDVTTPAEPVPSEGVEHGAEETGFQGNEAEAI
jgi:hypothetical protein